MRSAAIAGRQIHEEALLAMADVLPGTPSALMKKETEVGGTTYCFCIFSHVGRMWEELHGSGSQTTSSER